MPTDHGACPARAQAVARCPAPVRRPTCARTGMQQGPRPHMGRGSGAGHQGRGMAGWLLPTRALRWHPGRPSSLARRAPGHCLGREMPKSRSSGGAWGHLGTPHAISRAGHSRMVAAHLALRCHPVARRSHGARPVTVLAGNCLSLGRSWGVHGGLRHSAHHLKGGAWQDGCCPPSIAPAPRSPVARTARARSLSWQGIA